jgi:3-isopropylmalate dehydrogenase
MIESTRMLLEWLGHQRQVPQAVAAASSIGRGIVAALGGIKTRTGDIKGTGGTADMVGAVIAGL